MWPTGPRIAQGPFAFTLVARAMSNVPQIAVKGTGTAAELERAVNDVTETLIQRGTYQGTREFSGRLTGATGRRAAKVWGIASNALADLGIDEQGSRPNALVSLLVAKGRELIASLQGEGHYDSTALFEAAVSLVAALDEKRPGLASAVQFEDLHGVMTGADYEDEYEYDERGAAATMLVAKALHMEAAYAFELRVLASRYCIRGDLATTAVQARILTAR